MKTTNLEQNVGGVMNRHHKGSYADVVWNPGETQKSHCGDVMNHLLFEVLHIQAIAEQIGI